MTNDTLADRIILGWLADHGVQLGTLNDQPFAGRIDTEALAEGITHLTSDGPSVHATDPPACLSPGSAVGHQDCPAGAPCRPAPPRADHPQDIIRLALARIIGGPSSQVTMDMRRQAREAEERLRWVADADVQDAIALLREEILGQAQPEAGVMVLLDTLIEMVTGQYGKDRLLRLADRIRARYPLVRQVNLSVAATRHARVSVPYEAFSAAWREDTGAPDSEYPDPDLLADRPLVGKIATLVETRLSESFVGDADDLVITQATIDDPQEGDA